jgi:hypothetical protein
VTRLGDDLWGKGDAVSGGHTFGKGNVFSGKSIEDVLEAEGTLPNLE